MSKIIYSEEHLNVLRNNPNVDKCSTKSITYNKAFKLKAVKSYYDESLSPNMIFVSAGFDLNIIGKDKPRECLKLWKKIYKTKGQEELLKENRGRSSGRKPKTKEFADIEYLQTKIAYLEAENNFLRNLKTKTKH
jgi:hydrogenase maturation factor